MKNKGKLTLIKIIISCILMLVVQAILTSVFVYLYSMYQIVVNPSVIESVQVDKILNSSSLNISAILIAESIVFFTAVILTRIYKLYITKEFNYIKMDKKLLGFIVLFALSSVFLFSEIENIIANLVGRMDEAARLIIFLSKMPSITGLTLGIILVAVFPAFFKEILFRSIFQKQLVNRYGNMKGLIIASLIFAIFHVNPSAFLPLFLFSLVVGYVYIKTNYLYYSIILHFCYNLFTLMLVRYDGFGLNGVDNVINTHEHFDWRFFLGSFLITAALVFLMYRFKADKKIVESNEA